MSKRNPKSLGVWGDNGTRVVASESGWREVLKWNKAAANAGERHRVFCASMADVFEDRDELRAPRKRLVDLICNTLNLDWLLLTKRPQNALQMLVDAELYAVPNPSLPCPQPNLWIGTSVENQEAAEERIPHLLRCPAAVRFLSCEPLLGPLDLEEHITRSTRVHIALDVSGALRNRSFEGFTNSETGQALTRREAEAELKRLQAEGIKLIPMAECPGFDSNTGCPGHANPAIDWVIVGGESGGGARLMRPEWALSIRDQCQAAGVPFFFKQWGGVNKKAAGRELDGRLYDEFPKAVQP